MGMAWTKANRVDRKHQRVERWNEICKESCNQQIKLAYGELNCLGLSIQCITLLPLSCEMWVGFVRLQLSQHSCVHALDIFCICSPVPLYWLYLKSCDPHLRQERAAISKAYIPQCLELFIICITYAYQPSFSLLLDVFSLLLMTLLWLIQFPFLSSD